MPSSSITFRFLAEPSTVNFGGKVHGGVVMKWIDEAGYACASQWAGRYCVTASVGGIHFVRPIQVGHLVELKAQLAMTGRTSLHIVIEVSAGPIGAAERPLTTRCLIVFVAIDEFGKPADVPRFEPADEAARELWALADRTRSVSRQFELVGA